MVLSHQDSGASRLRFPESPDEQIWSSGLFDPEAHFGRRAPLEVEIGCGKARFLIESARRNGAHDFLGIELSLSYYRLCRDRIEKSGLPNARAVRADARRFVEKALPPESVKTFHIYFPDPWPKKRQRKRRLLDSVFLEILASRLVTGGLLRIATDHEDYGAVLEPLFEGIFALEPLEWNTEKTPVPTHYELKYHAEGRAIRRFLLRRVAAPQP